ncbi:MAG: 23S rRNA (pseudouridine(1915)-N(3))-methyltransferase RlmH [Oscillospiraceae bacterium]|nr:23S rRNA (pseudouridine(1915)-N(3))-methyltransferase RlmH [Oscillospiraceae bacterium]
MLPIQLICVGKLKEKFYQDACAEYIKRLSPHCKLEVIEVPEAKLSQSPSLGEITLALEKEAEGIRKKMAPNASIVALCIEGRQRSSEELAQLLLTWEQNSAKNLVFLIGGSNGLHPSLKAEAWVQLSMSPMTFPHHLARVMLLEQLYRAFKINEGSPYHK